MRYLVVELDSIKKVFRLPMTVYVLQSAILKNARDGDVIKVRFANSLVDAVKGSQSEDSGLEMIAAEFYLPISKSRKVRLRRLYDAPLVLTIYFSDTIDEEYVLSVEFSSFYTWCSLSDEEGNSVAVCRYKSIDDSFCSEEELLRIYFCLIKKYCGDANDYNL